MPGLIVGNMIDGLPGIELKGDGTLHYKNLGPVDTTTWKSFMTNISNYNLYHYRASVIKDNPMNFGRTDQTITASMTDLDVHYTTVVLTGGNAVAAIYAPGAGKKAVTFWLKLGCNFATQTQTYDIFFDEETSGNILNHIQPTAGNIWRDQIDLNYNSATADKDVQINISGGDGVETIYARVIAGKHS